VASLTLRMEFEEGARLPRWLGSAVRGGLGQHLRRIVCYRPMRGCEGCERAPECLFYAAYQKPYARRGHAPPPRPIVLVPPFFGRELELGRGGWLDVRMLLFGEYVRYLPHAILAIQQFGASGLGDRRHIGQNRFELRQARCDFSLRLVFDGGAIYPSRMRVIDVKELKPLEAERIRVWFRTPIELPKGFPPGSEDLLRLIWRRLVLYVNEYGSGERIPEPKCSGRVSCVSHHRHRLVGCSQRSGRREFLNCWTGIADYEFDEMDETARWLLSVGRVLGAGAKASFGCGFLEISPHSPKSFSGFSEGGLLERLWPRDSS